MSVKTVVFLGSKPIGYRCFEYLLRQQKKLGFQVIGLLTQARKEFGSGHDLAALATANNVPVIASSDELPECDFLYSVQYHEILKPHHLEKAKALAVNLHMAPLPEYRGSNQFSFAILDDKKEFGTTIHIMDPRIDHGAILFQKRFPIPEHCWVNELYERTFDASVQLFEETLPSILEMNVNPVAQSTLEETFGTTLHFRDEMKQLKEIDLSADRETIERFIRATSMPGFEPPFIRIGDRKVYLTPAAE